VIRIPGYLRPPANTNPAYIDPRYASTVKRGPRQAPILIPHTLSEITGPVFGWEDIKSTDFDLTKQHEGEPIGERIIVSGRVLDTWGKPISNTLVEIWQANAAGRYQHKIDQHHAPLDPNFTGSGRTMTDADGNYRFVTIKPGAYPWKNHPNAWRPQHIHFSLFGPSFCTRLVTQMYFPGDPLMEYDPMVQSIPTEEGRRRLISRFDLETTIPDEALGYRFDIVLRGREATPFEAPSSGGKR
jgi:protocatechuate 3,4-dioxygenase, beta subunit